ncbi:unnamed protein product [[Candida] boidinii]|uniref:Unnamed protein product n=1 Tax=Candida boidinii TaxID=5477 RepID=A0A9W6WKS5_CANBO|nr:unnamed protein product [[Candida] boidinii]
MQRSSSIPLPSLNQSSNSPTTSSQMNNNITSIDNVMSNASSVNNYSNNNYNNNNNNNNNSSNSPSAFQQSAIDGSIESNLGKEIRIILPPREIALQLITKTWENACVLFRFYHRPAFVEDLNELYDTDPSQYTNKQQRFLPLVYSVMACGALFYKSDEKTQQNDKKDPNNLDPESEVFEDEGYKYFIAARKLIDITDTRDTYGIQTIVMLIIFLQCSARLSTCYAYIGIALRGALREDGYLCKYNVGFTKNNK